MRPLVHLICGDAFDVLRSISARSVALTVTSPPYFKHRDYGVFRQIGRESTVDQYLLRIRTVPQELFRVTDDAGCCFFVVGDSYFKRRLLLVPHRIALSAVDAGWTLRNDLIWHKKDPPPESPRDRWRSAHEHILFLTKRPRGYRFNPDSIRIPHAPATIRRWGAGQTYGGEKSRSRRHALDSRMRHGRTFKLNPKGCLPGDVWSIACANSAEKHYAVFPESLAEQAISACSGPGDLVLDPFTGSGTTCKVALRLGRRALGIELNPEYARLATVAIEMELASRHRPQ
jgi:DNA modification methylase